MLDPNIVQRSLYALFDHAVRLQEQGRADATQRRIAVADAMVSMGIQPQYEPSLIFVTADGECLVRAHSLEDAEDAVGEKMYRTSLRLHEVVDIDLTEDE